MSPAPNREVLNSWKEIAQYLNRGIRTVQRWEAELGLPVHRPRANRRVPIMARREEIDAWLKRCPLDEMAVSQREVLPLLDLVLRSQHADSDFETLMSNLEKNVSVLVRNCRGIRALRGIQNFWMQIEFAPSRAAQPATLFPTDSTDKLQETVR